MLEALIGIDLATLIETVGYIGLFLIVFAESGLFFGFFLPGDSLLFTAGLIASGGYFNILIISIVCFVAAVLGDSFGFYFGKKVGPAIFTKEDSFFFNKKHLSRAQHFYEKYGGKTIILARFMPIVRTFAPILAGVGNMKYQLFFVYNIIGGFLWAVGLTMLGFFFGSLVPNADDYIFIIVVIIVFLSILPGVIAYAREYKRREENPSVMK